MQKILKWFFIHASYASTMLIGGELALSERPAPSEEVFVSDCCEKCAQLWPGGGPDWIITPNAGPCVRNGADIFITAEFIYWAVRQDHMAFVSLQDPCGNGCKGEFKQPDWKVWPGFKVGLGLFFDCDGWDLYTNYTWLRPRDTKRTVTPKTNFTLRDQFYVFPTTTVATLEREEGKWELDFNTLDLELGRNFFISSCLHLRPHFGLKGTWQKQRMDVLARGISTQLQVLTSESENHTDFWGVGIRAGLDSAWHFSRCFSLIGEVAATALWGRFESRTRIVDCNITDATFFIPTHVKTEYHSVKPVLDLLLGLRWENWFCCEEYHWSLDLGWEIQWWGGQNQFYLASNETRWGDLGLQGLTLKMRFDF